MASVGDFKHITVNRADEDEVIVAGAVEAGRPPEEPPSASAPSPSVPASAPEAPTASTRPKPKKAARGPAPDPTLEDLHTGPAPLAQKVVIIAAAVLIIAALVYYFAFMG